MRLAKHAFSEVAVGRRLTCMVCGGFGVGKNLHAERIIHKAGIPHVPQSRPNSEGTLYDYLWRERIHPVLLFNECDVLLRGEATCNMLKIAYGDEPRIVSLITRTIERNQRRLGKKRETYDPDIPPASFDLGTNARAVLLANSDFADPKVVASLPRQHWDALVSRG